MTRPDLWMGIAVLRGLEGLRPEGERLVDDPVPLRPPPGPWRRGPSRW